MRIISGCRLVLVGSVIGSLVGVGLVGSPASASGATDPLCGVGSVGGVEHVFVMSEDRGEVTLEAATGVVTGTAGADRIVVTGDAEVHGGDGDDIICVVGGTGGVDVRGNAGDDLLASSSEHAVDLSGGTGSDTLIGGPGGGTLTDRLTGEPTDTLQNEYYAPPTLAGDLEIIGSINADGGDTVRFDLAANGILLDALAGGTFDREVTGLGAGRVRIRSTVPTVIGSDHDDRLETRSSFRDVLSGGAGDDVVVGTGGYPLHSDDLLDGGPGVDTIAYPSVVAVELVLGETGSPGHALKAGPEGIDELWSFENVEGSGRFDRITGNSADNRITGGGGADVIDAGAGNDTIIAADPTGINVDGGPGTDTISYAAGGGGVVADLTAPGRAFAHADPDPMMRTDSLRDVENLTGTAYDDQLTGDAGDNVIRGGPGADTVRGGPGHDLLRGGPGKDVLRGGKGRDVLIGGANRDRCIGGPGIDSATLCEVQRLIP